LLIIFPKQLIGGIVVVIGVFVTVLLNVYNITVTIVEEVVVSAKGTCGRVVPHRNSFRCGTVIRLFIGDVFKDEMGAATAVVCIRIILPPIRVISINFLTAAGFNLINLTVVVVRIFCCIGCAVKGFF
jgi:hypothetical protein